jgi:hypothetical protein
VHEAGQASMLVRLFMWPFDCLESMRFKGMYGCAQMRTVLQDVEFNDQQRFNQFVARSKSHMEVGCVLYISTSCVSVSED